MEFRWHLLSFRRQRLVCVEVCGRERGGVTAGAQSCLLFRQEVDGRIIATLTHSLAHCMYVYVCMCVCALCAHYLLYLCSYRSPLAPLFSPSLHSTTTLLTTRGMEGLVGDAFQADEQKR